MIEQLMIVSGLSGAGKATAAKLLEDLHFTVVDNLPPVLLEGLTKAYGSSIGGPIRVAAVVDARSGQLFSAWPSALAAARAAAPTTVLFFDASDAVLVQRFKETRRRHPIFSDDAGILGTIAAERALLQELKESADRVIDTSDLDVHELRRLLASDYEGPRDMNRGLTITISSFGFKHGAPLDADLVFDVRFLANPHYVPELRPLDGRNAEVETYVMDDPNSIPFLEKLYDLMDFTLPRYIEEGKAYLTVAIGCTGGRHRSVVVSERLAHHLNEGGYRTITLHRDIVKS